MRIPRDGPQELLRYRNRDPQLSSTMGFHATACLFPWMVGATVIPYTLQLLDPSPSLGLQPPLGSNQTDFSATPTPSLLSIIQQGEPVRFSSADASAPCFCLAPPRILSTSAASGILPNGTSRGLTIWPRFLLELISHHLAPAMPVLHRLLTVPGQIPLWASALGFNLCLEGLCLQGCHLPPPLLRWHFRNQTFLGHLFINEKQTIHPFPFSALFFSLALNTLDNNICSFLIMLDFFPLFLVGFFFFSFFSPSPLECP